MFGEHGVTGLSISMDQEEAVTVPTQATLTQVVSPIVTAYLSLNPAAAARMQEVKVSASCLELRVQTIVAELLAAVRAASVTMHV